MDRTRAQLVTNGVVVERAKRRPNNNCRLLIVATVARPWGLVSPPSGDGSYGSYCWADVKLPYREDARARPLSKLLSKNIQLELVDGHTFALSEVPHRLLVVFDIGLGQQRLLGDELLQATFDHFVDDIGWFALFDCC